MNLRVCIVGVSGKVGKALAAAVAAAADLDLVSAVSRRWAGQSIGPALGLAGHDRASRPPWTARWPHRATCSSTTPALPRSRHT